MRAELVSTEVPLVAEITTGQWDQRSPQTAPSSVCLLLLLTKRTPELPRLLSPEDAAAASHAFIIDT